MHMINYLKRHTNMIALCSELASLTVVPLKLIKIKHPQTLSVLPWSAKSDTVNAKTKKKMQKDELSFSQLLSTTVRLTDFNLHLKTTCLFIPVLINAVCTPKYKWSITQYTYFLYGTLAAYFKKFFSFSCIFLTIFRLSAWRFIIRFVSCWTKIVFYWFCSFGLLCCKQQHQQCGEPFLDTKRRSPWG